MKQTKLLLILCLIFAGCTKQATLPMSDTLAAEGFTAFSVANYNRTHKDAPVVKEGVSIYPKKYLRLLSARTGCGPCIHQDQILLGSDWIMRDGTEEDNKDKRPYHGLRERVESLKDRDNPLWAKYKPTGVPFWQLIVDGKVVKTNAGVLSLNELNKFYTE